MYARSSGSSIDAGAHPRNGGTQPREHRLADDGVADVEFVQAGKCGHRADVHVIERVAGVELHAMGADCLARGADLGKFGERGRGVAAVAVAMLLLLVAPIMLLQRSQGGSPHARGGH